MLSVSIEGGGAAERKPVEGRRVLARVTVNGAESFELVVLNLVHWPLPTASHFFAAPLYHRSASFPGASERGPENFLVLFRQGLDFSLNIGGFPRISFPLERRTVLGSSLASWLASCSRAGTRGLAAARPNI